MQSINSNSKPFYLSWNNILSLKNNELLIDKINIPPPRYLRPRLDEFRAVFKKLMLFLIQSKFSIVCIDKWTFNPHHYFCILG